MILRNLAYLLGILLFLPEAKANKGALKAITDDLQPVTIRIWKSQDAQKLDGHISLQTQKHYISLISVAELGLDIDAQRSYIFSTDDVIDIENSDPMSLFSSAEGLFVAQAFQNLPRAFAPSTHENDQHIQNDRQLPDSEPWPYESEVVFLKAKLIDDWWEKFTAKSKPFSPLNDEPKGSRFDNVRYVDKSTRESLQIPDYWSDNDEVHHFSDVSLIHRLLHVGEYDKTGVSRLENAKYFKEELSSFKPLPISGLLRTLKFEDFESIYSLLRWGYRF